jgi:3,4-dihydroxy 2-butanone 4-phosphate synthase / GTP cyclohydrolase II
MSPITAAVTTLANGGMVLVVDDEDRENEGDLIMAAEYAGTDAVAFFLEHTSGFLCVAVDEARADALGLGLMVPDNTEVHRTAFLVSVDYRHGTTSGITPATARRPSVPWPTRRSTPPTSPAPVT